jgi:hypothetical protein
VPTASFSRYEDTSTVGTDWFVDYRSEWSHLLGARSASGWNCCSEMAEGIRADHFDFRFRFRLADAGVGAAAT